MYGLAAAATGEENLNETEAEMQKKGKQETCFSISQAAKKKLTEKVYVL